MHQPRNSQNWYINMNQSVFNANGGLINVISISKLVSPVSGNMHVAVYAVKEGRTQLKQYLPFIKTRYNKTPQWISLGSVNCANLPKALSAGLAVPKRR